MVPRLKLEWPAVEGLHRCWVNDVGGRLDERLVDGYRHVMHNGEQVSRMVGQNFDGSPLVAFLMECSYESYLVKIGTIGPIIGPEHSFGLSATPVWERFLPRDIMAAQSTSMSAKETADRLFEDDEPQPEWSPWRIVYHAAPSCRFLGLFNWHRKSDADGAWFRLIFRPHRDWHLYFRLSWRPKLKIDLETERRISE